MCHGFLGSATKAGYVFPDDIAIIGFDNLPICLHHQPTISSISTPYPELGQLAFDTIRSAITAPNKQNGMLTLLPTTIKERQSS
jgi:DNA-binding LacI/PurR family transcriptional regulator